MLGETISPLGPTRDVLGTTIHMNQPVGNMCKLWGCELISGTLELELEEHLGHLWSAIGACGSTRRAL